MKKSKKKSSKTKAKEHGKFKKIALLFAAIAAILDDVSPRRSSMRASPEYKRAMIEELIQMGIEELNA